MTTTSVDRPGDAGVDVDPRIAARRDEVTRGRDRRRRRRLVAVIAVVAGLAGAWGLTRTSLLDVDEVLVEGNQRTSTDELLAASEVLPGDPLVDLDAAAVRRRLLALPWIADARVERAWGGSVLLSVSERTPVASVARGDGSSVLVDVEGRALALTGDAAASATSGVVPLEGVVASDPGTDLDPRAHEAIAVAAALSPALRSRVAAVVVRGDDGIELRLRPSGSALLGRGVDPASSLASLLTVLAQIDLTDLALVDLRVPDQPVVSRTAAPAPGATTVPTGKATTSTSVPSPRSTTSTTVPTAKATTTTARKTTGG